ncbi:endo-1,4-beta-xylanase [Candidatus Methylacidiphilum infernorum]|uniref:Endo-1,4-beta-xylanase n=1 Tax=Candidatus Methylacidiphilum infernorum TaxID=511746 RepID=A0ABX7PW95_9BACT|nr:endo-1,4-beta-xylanase [Candidatus Methylacidiphilum infernorum]QSR86998.1 endo-1,4-beta-xylanase [Candidatus Methylacidiphilum infernorum]
MTAAMTIAPLLILGIFLFPCKAAPLEAAIPPDSPYGVDINFVVLKNELGLQMADPLLEGLEQAGIGYLRIGLSWTMVEPRPGEWTFNRTDAIVQAALRHHMRILAELGDVPSWASSAPAGSPLSYQYPPRSWNNWAEYVLRVSSRYKGIVTAWKVMNEPGLLNRRIPAWTPQTYARALAIAYKQIHRVEPEAIVLSGCVWWDLPPTAPLMRYYRALVNDAQNPLYKNIDAFNMHYNDIPPSAQARWLRDAREVMARDAGRKLPIWIDEVAYPANPEEQNDLGYQGGPEAQARYLLDTLRTNFSNPQVKKVFWTFAFDAPGRTHGPVEYSWGLFAVPAKGQIRPRPALESYRSYIRDNQ